MGRVVGREGGAVWVGVFLTLEIVCVLSNACEREFMDLSLDLWK